MSRLPVPPALDQPASPKPVSTADLLKQLIDLHQTRSGTWGKAGAIIANTGISQQALPANPLRKYLLIQAYSGNAASLWFDISGDADNGPFSLELTPGQSMTFEAEFVGTGPVYLNGTAGDKAMLREGYHGPLTAVE